MAFPTYEPLELHSGSVSGRRHSPDSLAAQVDGPERNPREVFDARLLEALQHPPCHVLFSGGKDSSVVLAGALALAREHGLPMPIALTTRYPAHARTHEDEWQEQVIRHLGAEQWDIHEVGSELGLLDGIATSAMLRYGPYWPGNAHSLLLFARLAGSGTLVSGIGGDEIFDRWGGRRDSVREVLALRPITRALKWGTYYALPRRVRFGVDRRRYRVSLPWLRPEVEAEVNARIRESTPRSPTWRLALQDFLESRYFELVRAVVTTFVGDLGMRSVDPFMDPEMILSVARTGPRDGYESRGQALQRFFGDLLPPEILTRQSKAVFNEVNWNPAVREFVASWDGSGPDPALVDPDRLRLEWRRDAPDGRTLPCLQLAWLAAQ